MILDNIRHRSAYAEQQDLSLVLEYFFAADEETFPARRVELLENRIFVNPAEFTTKPESECVFEAHRRYADVHYIVSGCERITVSPLESVSPLGPFDAEKDFGLYGGGGGTVCILRPGDFLVCYPQDAHRVSAAVEGPAAVRKLVGKIRV